MQDKLSTPLTVRDARPEDVPQLVALINALNVHEGGVHTMTEVHAEFVLFSPQRPVPLQCVVSCSAREVVGFVLYYRGYDTASTSFGYHIADIFVLQEKRAQGVGAILMAEVAKRCLDSGGQWCSLTVLQNNRNARLFYDALGFHAPDVSFRAVGPKGLEQLCSKHL